MVSQSISVLVRETAWLLALLGACLLAEIQSSKLKWQAEGEGKRTGEDMSVRVACCCSIAATPCLKKRSTWEKGWAGAMERCKLQKDAAATACGLAIAAQACSIVLCTVIGVYKSKVQIQT